MSCITLPSINTNIIIPDINDILPAFNLPFAIPSFALPNFDPLSLVPPIPALPSIPMPPSLAMPNYTVPCLTSVYAAAGLVQAQVMMVIKEILGKINKVIPIPALPALPGLPEFTVTLDFQFDVMAMLSALRLKLVLPDFAWPAFLPPLWPTIQHPELQAFSALQHIIANFSKLLVDLVMSMVDKVLALMKSLKLPGVPALPTLPKMPSLNELIALIMAKVPSLPPLPEVPSLDDIKAMLPQLPGLPNILPLAIPGFPSFSLPSPLMPNLNIPDFELSYLLQNLQTMMTNFCVKKITDFLGTITGLLSAIGISFALPTLSMLLGALPSLPPICHPDLPENLMIP